MVRAFWDDEQGVVVSAELILVATILILSLVVGLGEVRNAIDEELEDVASALGRVNQSYGVIGVSGAKGQTSGSGFVDEIDFCDSPYDIVGIQPVAEIGVGGDGSDFDNY